MLSLTRVPSRPHSTRTSRLARARAHAPPADEKAVDEKFSLHYRMKTAIIELFERRNLHQARLGEGARARVRGCAASSHARALLLHRHLHPRALLPPYPRPQICTLEQVLVTGCDAEGGTVAAKEIDRSMRELMGDQRLTSEDQARLMVLYVLCARAADPKVRAELLASSHITPRHQHAIANLNDLKVPTTRTVRGRGAGRRGARVAVQRQRHARRPRVA